MISEDHKILIRKASRTAMRLKNALQMAKAENNWDRADYIKELWRVFMGCPVERISVSQWEEAYEILEILYPDA